MQRYQGEPELTPRGKSKVKNTKKWCRGKVGKPHTVVTETNSYFGWSCRWMNWWTTAPSRGGEPEKRWQCVHVKKCTDCGKILQQFVDPKECPAYIREIKNDG